MSRSSGERELFEAETVDAVLSQLDWDKHLPAQTAFVVERWVRNEVGKRLALMGSAFKPNADANHEKEP